MRLYWIVNYHRNETKNTKIVIALIWLQNVAISQEILKQNQSAILHKYLIWLLLI